MPPLIRFMLSQFANGVALGLAVGLCLLWADVAELQRLLATARQETALTVLFLAQTALLFGTFAMNVAVMNLPPSDS